MKPVLIVLSGPPCIGKSTFVDEWSVLPLVFSKRLILLSSDEIIEAYASMVDKTYTEVFPDMIAESTRQVQYLKNWGIKHNNSFIWDQTNIGRHVERMEPFVGYTKICVKFLGDGDFICKRNLNRPGKVIPDDVLKSMIQRNKDDVSVHTAGYDHIEEIHVDETFTFDDFAPHIENIINFLKEENGKE